jgi:hypothetical protein
MLFLVPRLYLLVTFLSLTSTSWHLTLNITLPTFKIKLFPTIHSSRSQMRCNRTNTIDHIQRNHFHGFHQTGLLQCYCRLELHGELRQLSAAAASRSSLAVTVQLTNQLESRQPRSHQGTRDLTPSKVEDTRNRNFKSYLKHFSFDLIHTFTISFGGLQLQSHSTLHETETTKSTMK